MVAPLSEQHLQMLADSGITAEQAAARGYETITEDTASRLAEIRIVTDARRLVPGLLIPMLRIDGSTWGYQYRPDKPRLREGKIVKYETPWQQRNGLDVPPGVGDLLGDPNVPLWVTEGSKKADCGALHGLCIVALTGVWNWLGQNTAGGKVAIEDWRDCALNGRRVILAFDGDVARKESVQKSLHALAAYLSTKGAKVEYLWLPDTDNKTGLDDYLAEHTVDELWSLVKSTKPPVTQIKADQPTADEPPAAAADTEIRNGAELLDDVLATLKKYVVFGDEHQAVAVALWIAATHALPAWQHATRLAVGSPQKRCGKSRLMDVTAGMSFNPLSSTDATTAALFRSIGNDDAETPALFVDEADGIFGSRRLVEDNKDLQTLFNAGWQRGRAALRCVGPQQTPTEFATFSMAMLAGIGRLPDTIVDRAVNIDLKRRAPGETVARFRERRDRPKLQKLREQLTAWSRQTDRLRRLAEAEPDMPRGVEDRAADAWEPLIAIADEAGGDWPKLARAACQKLVKAAEADDQNDGTVLLQDIRGIFDGTADKFIPSQALVNELRKLDESPWKDAELTVRKLAVMLKPYGVHPGQNVAKTQRGYTRDGFVASFRRYTRPEVSKCPENRADQHEHAANAENEKCPEVSGSVRDPSDTADAGHFGTLRDGSPNHENSPDSAGTGDFLDTWTLPDTYTAGNGTSAVCGGCCEPLTETHSIDTGMCAECRFSKPADEDLADPVSA